MGLECRLAQRVESHLLSNLYQPPNFTMTPSVGQQTIGEKVLELTKLLCQQESNFTLRVKCGDFRFYLDSKPRQITEAIPVKQQRKSPRQKERDKRRRMEFFERKTASSKNQVLGKKGSEGAETEGGNPLSTLSQHPPQHHHHHHQS